MQGSFNFLIEGFFLLLVLFAWLVDRVLKKVLHSILGDMAAVWVLRIAGYALLAAALLEFWRSHDAGLVGASAAAVLWGTLVGASLCVLALSILRSAETIAGARISRTWGV
jgi:hypothetical protein